MVGVDVGLLLGLTVTVGGVTKCLEQLATDRTKVISKRKVTNLFIISNRSAS